MSLNQREYLILRDRLDAGALTGQDKADAELLVGDYERESGGGYTTADLKEDTDTVARNITASVLGLPGDLLSLVGLKNEMTSEALAEKLGGDVEHDSWLAAQLFSPGPGELAGLAGVAGVGITGAKIERASRANKLRRWNELEDKRKRLAGTINTPDTGSGMHKFGGPNDPRRANLFRNYDEIVAEQKSLERDISQHRQTAVAHGVGRALDPQLDHRNTLTESVGDLRARESYITHPVQPTTRLEPTPPVGRQRASEAGPSLMGPERGAMGPNEQIAQEMTRPGAYTPSRPMTEEELVGLEATGRRVDPVPPEKVLQNTAEYRELLDEKLADYTFPLLSPYSTAAYPSSFKQLKWKKGKAVEEVKRTRPRAGRYATELPKERDVFGEIDYKDVIGTQIVRPVKPVEWSPRFETAEYRPSKDFVGPTEDRVGRRLTPEERQQVAAAREKTPLSPQEQLQNKFNRLFNATYDADRALERRYVSAKGPMEAKFKADIKAERETIKHRLKTGEITQAQAKRLRKDLNDRANKGYEGTLDDVIVDALQREQKVNNAYWATRTFDQKKVDAAQWIEEGNIGEMHKYFGKELFAAVRNKYAYGRYWKPKLKRKASEARELPPDWYMNAEDTTKWIWKELIDDMVNNGGKILRDLWKPSDPRDLRSAMYQHFERRASELKKMDKAERLMYMAPDMRNASKLPYATTSADVRKAAVDEYIWDELAPYEPELRARIEASPELAADFNRAANADKGDEWIRERLMELHPDVAGLQREANMAAPSIERIEKAIEHDDIPGALGLRGSASTGLFNQLKSGPKAFEDMPLGSVEEFGGRHPGMRQRLFDNALADATEAPAATSKPPAAIADTGAAADRGIRKEPTPPPGLHDMLDSPVRALNLDDIDVMAGNAIERLRLDGRPDELLEAVERTYKELRARTWKRSLSETARKGPGKGHEYFDEYRLEAGKGDPVPTVYGTDTDVPSIAHSVRTDVARDMGLTAAQKKALDREWDKFGKLMEEQKTLIDEAGLEIEDRIFQRALDGQRKAAGPQTKAQVRSGLYDGVRAQIQDGARSAREKTLVKSKLREIEERYEAATTAQERDEALREYRKWDRHLRTVESRVGQSRVSRPTSDKGDYSTYERQKNLRGTRGGTPSTGSKKTDADWIMDDAARDEFLSKHVWDTRKNKYVKTGPRYPDWATEGE
ncbi:MAG: hypothetical protein ACYTFQ_09355 [Planctomycetota bacterium]|jgi:hypothetical protein